MVAEERRQKKQQRERRVMALCVSQEAILAMLSPSLHFRYTAPGLPEDAEAVAVHFDWLRDAFVVEIRSESFAPVPEFEQVPWLGFGLRVEDLRPVSEETPADAPRDYKDW